MTSTNNERGFTLIEVLFAMVILTVALVALAELMAITLRMQMQGRNATAAVRVAQAKIDELIGLNFNDTVLTDFGGSVDADVASYNDNPADAPGYHRRWQIDDIGEDRVRLLTVVVIPTSNDRRSTAPVKLTTIIRSIEAAP